MIYLGIDPGLVGALATLHDKAGLIDLQPTPTLDGDKPLYDLPGIRRALIRAKAIGRECGGIVAVVERLDTLPPKMRGKGGALKAAGGGKANFARGEARAWAWALTMLEIPFHLVRPQVWQKVMHAGAGVEDTKQASVLIVQRLFPNASLLRTGKGRKPDHGLADALLMAEYGRRTFAPAPLLQAGA